MPVDATTVLGLWERARPLDDTDRAVVLAGAVAPSATAAEVVDWPLGRRDARLLDLRSALSGPELEAVATCPDCAEEISFTLDVDRLGPGPSEDAATYDTTDDGEPSTVTVDGWRVRCRRLTSADLAAAAVTGDPAAGEDVLLSRAMVDVEPPAGTQSVPLPPAVRRAVTDALATADPLAEVVVELACPDCATGLTAIVDVAAFAWAAVDGHARRLLHDVDVLARAYGWNESEVLTLGDQRRAAYLDLALGGAP